MIRHITPQDPHYPPQFKNLPDHPKQLYFRGNSALLQNTNMFAVVGTRKISSYGVRLISFFVRPLLAHNMIIVSGLALGTDAQAHKETLENKGTTIAVLGSGLDDASIAPSSNVWLAHKILANGGLLLSEYPPGTPGYAAHFPQRNRIITGLARGVLVTEAAERSGTLITARFAAEYSREVFACPGNIFSPLSAGTHKLIANGALLATHPNDILLALGYTETHAENLLQTQQRRFTTQPEIQSLLACFANDSEKNIEDLKQETDIAQQKLLAYLTQLEYEGAIIAAGGGRYILKS